MAGKIKGITIELNGDTRKLDASLKNVNKTSNKLNTELKQIQESLKFNPGNTDILAQQQRVLGEQIKNTSSKYKLLLDEFKLAETQLKNGEIGQKTFDELKREILKTKNQLDNYNQKLKESIQEEKNLGIATKSLKTFFDATGHSIDDYADSVGSKLVDAYKRNQLSAKQTESILSKIEHAYLGAEGYAEEFNKTLKNLDNKSIDDIESSLVDMKNKAYDASTTIDDTQKSLVSLGISGEVRDSLQSLFSALKDGASKIKDVLSGALDYKSEQTKLELRLNLNSDDTKVVKESLNHVKALGVDGEEALQGIATQMNLNKDATIEQNRAFVENAAALSTLYSGIDFGELVQEVNEIGASIGISNEEALALTDSLLHAGLKPDELDIISEYSLQLKNAGFNAEQIRAIFASGVDVKSWNIDNLLDGLKEGRVRMSAFGNEIPKALGSLLDKASISRQEFQKLGQDIALGGKKGKKAMEEVAGLIENISDETVQSEIGVQVYGTKWEDQGTNITKTIKGINGNLVEMDKMVGQTNERAGKINAGGAVKFQEALLNMKDAIAPLLQNLADFVSHIADFVKAHPKVSAFIGVVITGLTILIPIITALSGVIMAVAVAGGVANVALLPIIAIIAGIIVAVVAIIAAIVFLKNNWSKIWNAIKNFFSGVWDGIKNTVQGGIDFVKNIISTGFNAVKDFISNVWNGIKTFTSIVWEGIKFVVTAPIRATLFIIRGIINAIKNNISSVWEGIKTVTSIVWEGIKTVATAPIRATLFVIRGIINAIKNNISSVWEGIKSVTSRVWNGVKTAITAPIKAAKTVIKSIIDKIKGFFNFKIKFPKIPLPHFSIKPKGWKIGDLVKGKIPSLGINWHSQGGIFKSPTLLQSRSGVLHGVGEAGAEAIMPLNKLQELLDFSGNQIDYAKLASAVAVATTQALIDADLGVKLDERVIGRLNADSI